MPDSLTGKRRVSPKTAEAKPYHTPDVLEALARFELQEDFQPADGDRTIDPRRLALALDRLLPAERRLVYDSGNFLGVLPLVAVPEPRALKPTSDFASVGLGLPTSIGVACAPSERPTVLFIGDGGLLMTLGELETAGRLGARLIVTVLHYLAPSRFPTSTSPRSPRLSASRPTPSDGSRISRRFKSCSPLPTGQSSWTARSPAPSRPASWPRRRAGPSAQADTDQVTS